MARKVDKKGFTLIELLVTLAIVGILTSIGVGSFLSSKSKREMENDIKKIYAILQKYRIKAYSEKKVFTTDLTNSKLFKVINISTATVEESVTLNQDFGFKSSSVVSIDTRGTFSGSSIKPLNGNIKPEYNCLTVDDTEVKFGLWSGSDCEVK